MIFPPPSSQDVLFCQYCMNLDRVIVVLVDGKICIYKLLLEVQEVELETSLVVSEIKDSFGKNQT